MDIERICYCWALFLTGSGKAEDLVEAIYNRFRDEFVVGETITYTSSGSDRYSGFSNLAIYS